MSQWTRLQKISVAVIVIGFIFILLLLLKVQSTDIEQPALPTLIPIVNVIDEVGSDEMVDAVSAEPAEIELSANEPPNPTALAGISPQTEVLDNEPPSPPAFAQVNVADTQEDTHDHADHIDEISQIIDSTPTIIDLPSEAVAGQVVLHFDARASEQDRADYIASIGGTIVQRVDALNSVVVTIPNQNIDLPQTEFTVDAQPDYYVTALADITTPPNDPYYADQWALPVIGAADGWAGLADDAAQVIVAVIDSGVCLDHPDLAGRILAGYDFVDDDNIAQDDFGHGCGVAGIIAANIDNGIGIAGVAPNAMIMPVRVLSATGVGTYSDVSAGIVYAVDNGAEIINLSLGGVNQSALLEAAVNYAVEQGVTVVAAAGNTGGAVVYPAKYAPVIAVGSLDQNLQPSSFSANGVEVDEWAPGRDILMPSIDNDYAYFNGTSFSAPFVSGELALGLRNVIVDLAPEVPDPSETSVPNNANTLTGWITSRFGDPRAGSGDASIFEVYLVDETGETIAQLNLDHARAESFSRQQVEITTNASLNNLQADTLLDVLSITSIDNSVEAELTGSKPYINVLCRFSDIAAVPFLPNEYAPLFANVEPGLDHYWRQVSYNNIDIVGTTTISQWVDLPQPRSFYVNDITNVANLDALADDCAAAADSVVFFPDYFGINFMFNDDLDCCAWGGTHSLFIDGQFKIYSTTWLPPWGQTYDVVAHEMGHAFGLPHSSGPADNPPAGLSIYVSQWDVMSSSAGRCFFGDLTFGCMAPGTIGFHVDLDEWIPPARLVTIDTNSVQTITLERLHQPVSATNPLMAIVEISPGHFYTVEARFNNIGYDRNIPGSAVIIHDVLLTRTGNTGPSLVVDADDGNDNVNDAGAMWTVGEVYADTVNDITISVLSSTASSFTVEINKGGVFVPPEPTVAEVNALIALYNSTNGASWTTNTGWLVEPNACDWVGVTCDVDGHVSQLNLWANNLNGTLPPEIGDLTYLQVLVLPDNQLTGSLPPEIGNLTEVQYLYLANNQFSGALPAGLGNMTQMVELWLASNQFNGSLPSGLANMTSLNYFSLFNNQLTGSIPTGFGDATNLQFFTLGANDLTGAIPSDLGNLSNLTFLDLSGNSLNGNIPTELGNLSSLQNLWLYSNNLDGNIPASLGNLSNLQVLYLSQNLLDGAIPTELGNLSLLQEFALDSNALTGSIPVNLTNLSNATYFDLWNNQLTGTIPPAFGTMTNLEYLNLGVNQLDGAIPPELGNLNNLFFLYLAVNDLTGTIPPELANLTVLEELYLSFNQLTGAIPSELGSLSNLAYLYLNGNQLDGVIPTELGNLTNLIELTFARNQLAGAVPPELGNLVNLNSLDVSNNALIGEIPATFTNLTSLTVNPNTNFDFNALYTTDAGILAFANSKDPDWVSSQTVAPSNIQVTASTSTSITLSWDAIPYTADGGYYEVLYSETTGAPYENSGCTTADKTETSCEVTGLTPDTTYFMVVRTFTPAHGVQQNDLLSDLSAEISSVIDIQYNALVALYNSTDGDNWDNNFGWLVNPDVCTWWGITCNVDGDVTEINLDLNSLAGTIPPEIGNLTDLTDLSLESGGLTGNIPTEIGNLSSLVNLSLFGNALNGSIPASIANLTNLQVLDLSFNELTGSIPTELGTMPNLVFLDFWWNQLTGNIPVELSQIDSLEVISLAGNQLTGSIPSELGSLPNLIALYLDVNDLTGSIPPQIAGSASLIEFSATNNELSGSIPSEFGSAPNLTGIDFSYNNLTGTIPPELGNSSTLQYLGFSFNQLDGTIPNELSSLDLTDLLLADNQLTGTIPTWLGNATNLELLYLAGNQFTGGIPSELGNLVNLIEISLARNALTGEIPTSMVNLVNLNPSPINDEIDFGFNALYTSDAGLVAFLNTNDPGWSDSQTIAPANLQVTASTETTFTLAWDVIPYTADGGYYEVLYSDTTGAPYTSGCTTADKTATTCEITGLTANTDYFMVVRTFTPAHDTQQNDLFSDLSAEVSASTSSTDDYNALLALYNSTDGDNWSINTNWLTDPDVCTWYGITCDVGGDVTAIALGNNNLVGTLPNEIGDLSNLITIDFRLNTLSGSLPTSLTTLVDLVSFNILGNELTGNIPVGFGATSLQYFDVSLNQLDGSIPADLATLTGLTHFSVFANQLTGTVPTGFGNATNLSHFSIGSNQLTGAFPSDIAGLTQLTDVNMAVNNLTGSIPVGFGSAPNLFSLNLGRNQLDGTIPNDLANALSLEYLTLSENQLTGTIPPELGNLTNLVALSLFDNQLDGTIPSGLGALTNLVSLRLGENQLTGEIPSELGNLVNLHTLDLGRNALVGEIPQSFKNLGSLGVFVGSFVDVDYNALYINDAIVLAFWDDKDSGWSDTQTIAPSNIQVTASTETSITLTWDVIPYTTDGGYYEVLYSETTGAPYASSGCTTADKNATTCEITGLTANTDYFMVVRTFTPAHDTQQNDLFSDLSAEVSASTNGVNTAPTADDQTIDVDQNGFVVITLTGSDPEGDTLSFNILTNPTEGLLSGIAPTVTYTPDLDYIGADSFTFEVCDTGLLCDSGTINITVNEVFDTLPSMPVITAPLPVVSDTTPDVIWADTDDAASYRIYVREAESNIVVYDMTLSADSICDLGICQITLPELNEVYHLAYVRGQNPLGWGLWSAVTRFVPTSFTELPTIPVITAPIGFVGDTTPDVVWADTGDATSYRVYVREVDSFDVVYDQTLVTATICNLGTCQVTLPELNEVYHLVYVRGQNPLGWGAWSDNSRFGISSTFVDVPTRPVITAPIGAVGDTTPDVVWEHTGDATSYRIYVREAQSHDVVYNQTLDYAGICDINTGLCQVTLPELGQDIYHIAYVRGQNPLGWSQWSQRSRFITSAFADVPARPDVTAPEGDISDTTPDVVWTDTGDADSYRIFVREVQGNTVIYDQTLDVASVCLAGTCQITLPELNAVAHLAYVRGQNPIGWGNWSQRSRFTVEVVAPLATPAIVMDAQYLSGIEGQTLFNNIRVPNIGNGATAVADSGTLLPQLGGGWIWRVESVDNQALTTVTITVTDAQGETITATFDYELANVNPSATFTQVFNEPVFQGTSSVFNFSNVNDVSSADVESGFDYAVVCDAQSTETLIGTQTNYTCTYDTAGFYTATGMIRDKDGGISSYSLSVEVLTPLASAEYMQSNIEANVALNVDASASLSQSLATVQASLSAGNSQIAIAQVSAFIEQVQSYASAGTLTPAQGDALIGQAQRLISSIISTQ